MKYIDFNTIKNIKNIKFSVIKIKVRIYKYYTLIIIMKEDEV